ncbi:hypothetical protein COCOBI_02-3590 [Coccomyxa sp. Obi]|nr:hypothetical protein COCOBI_02-3590 [Coccomyxa sp. Obi]
MLIWFARHPPPQDLPTDTALKRSYTSTELAATLSSPDSFDRVAVDYMLEDAGIEQEQGHHERKGQKKKPADRDVSTLMPASSLSRREGSQRIMVWRSSSLDQDPSDAEAGTSMDIAIDSSRETFAMIGADFSAPSITTTSTSRAAQLFDLALDDDMPSGVITPLASLTTTVNEAMWQDSLKKATIAILLKLEEILPRPNEGLLKRMLRLSDVRLLTSTDNGPPTLHLKAGAEYRVALQILPSPQWRQGNVRHCLKRVIMGPRGGRARTMQVLQEGNDQEHVWTGACVWVTDRVPKSESHHDDDGEARPITMSLELGKTIAGGEEEEICINMQLRATFDAVRGSSISEYDTTGPQNALLNMWKVAPEGLFSNASDIILCEC